MIQRFDLVVIGTGTAASGVANRCRNAGWSVAIVDERPFGGRMFTRGKAQTDHGPERPKRSPGVSRTACGSGSPELSLSVPSIRCQGCVETIEANLRLEPGIGRIEGDVESKTIRVAYDASDTSPDAIEAAVTRLGHRVEKRSA